MSNNYAGLSNTDLGGTANGIKTLTTTVSCGDATAPTNGQVLIAQSSTSATWGAAGHIIGTTGTLLSLSNTTQSTNTTTGALIVAGGAGIAKNVHIGGTLDTTGVVNLNNTTASSQATNGALVVDGGVGIAKQLFVGGTGSFAGGLATDATAVTGGNTAGGALQSRGGLGVAKDIVVGDVVEIRGTTQSTTTGTGALIVAGGVGIAKDTFIGGTLDVTGATNINNTTQSTTTNSGALIVDGGVGIAKDVFIGGTLSLGGNESFGYDEGTWTPVYTPASGAFTTLTMDVVNATYVKIGTLVNCVAFVRTDNVVVGTANGVLYLSGLPFTCATNGFSAINISTSNSWGGDYPWSGYVVSGDTKILLEYRTTSNGTATAMDVTDMVTGANADSNSMVLQFTYIASS